MDQLILHLIVAAEVRERISAKFDHNAFGSILGGLFSSDAENRFSAVDFDVRAHLGDPNMYTTPDQIHELAAAIADRHISPRSREVEIPNGGGVPFKSGTMLLNGARTARLTRQDTVLSFEVHEGDNVPIDVSPGEGVAVSIDPTVAGTIWPREEKAATS